MMPEISRSQIEELLFEWIIGKNAERDRAILRRRLYDGITYERLAEEFGLSVRCTKSIVYKAQEKIFKHVTG